MTTTQLPVLFLNDLVVLPGMVVPIELDDSSQAAVDAARAEQRLASCWSRPGWRTATPSYGVVATIEQVGRLATGEPAAVIRAERRARIGSGVTGPGAALWVEAEELSRSSRSPRPITRAGGRVQGARRRDRCSGATRGRSSTGQPGHRPVHAGRPRRLRALPHRRAEAPAAGDPGRRRAADLADRVDQGPPRRGRGQREDRRRRPRGHGEEPARVPAAPAAQRDPQGARRGRARRRRRTTAPGSRRPTCPRTSARRPCARSTSSSGPATRAPRPAGSAPGSTPSSTCRGAPRPTTRPTSRRRARCSTPTTTAWTT